MRSILAMNEILFSPLLILISAHLAIISEKRKKVSFYEISIAAGVVIMQKT